MSRTLAALALLVPSLAQATLFVSNPDDAVGGQVHPGAPTFLYAIEEDGSGFEFLGEVRDAAGTSLAIGAIALDAGGGLWGFVYDDTPSPTSTFVAITEVDEEWVATPVGADPIAGDVSGAAFDLDGALWVYVRRDDVGGLDHLGYPTPDAGDVYAVDPVTLVPLTVPTPIPVLDPDPALDPDPQINGGDIAFDQDGTCWFQATIPGNTSTPLYRCELDLATLELTFVEETAWTAVGMPDPSLPDVHPSGAPSFSGIATSLHPETCEPVLMGADGYNIDELYALDAASGDATWVASTGVNVSWFNHIDMAGFPNAESVDACASCGDGFLDADEECDDGNLIPGDGCSPECTIEPDDCGPDSDGDGIGDDCDICPGGDDNVDTDGDGVPDHCDLCPGGDDTLDSDGDGVPDCCDPCPYGDDHDPTDPGAEPEPVPVEVALPEAGDVRVVLRGSAACSAVPGAPMGALAVLLGLVAVRRRR